MISDLGERPSASLPPRCSVARSASSASGFLGRRASAYPHAGQRRRVPADDRLCLRISAGLAAAHVILDPSRVAAQVVSGIGFLEAGAIGLRGQVVRGLTTAASASGGAVAAVGLAAGGGLYFAATVSTGIILLILAGVKPIEEVYRSRVQSCVVEAVNRARGRWEADSVKKHPGPARQPDPPPRDRGRRTRPDPACSWPSPGSPMRTSTAASLACAARPECMRSRWSKNGGLRPIWPLGGARDRRPRYGGATSHRHPALR